VSDRPLTLRLNPSLQFQEGEAFFNLIATFLAATAGMTPVFDEKGYPDFLAGTDGVYQGTVRPETRVDLPAVLGLIRRRRAASQRCRQSTLLHARNICVGCIALQQDTFTLAFR